ncbi:PREDICTED: probable ubiquitin carboxyl-terminal hydrolase FAM188B [Hipposideros armiger]|uniref:Ubiquitin carboxyl-terminal hydrolase MINDY n=1 Tax=Hipposideros armiger TaxID=186990 RepID=A0A8B7R6S8_HIPAR|nr:PREDICTED: probable ubiquitin carboxyl-terminal hydrolase FAM188B [Hipposideros armiger]
MTWLLGGTGLWPCGFCLPLPEASLKDAPPLPACLPALWLPGKGRSSPGADDTVAKATRPYWPTDPGAWGLHGRGLVGRAGSMDSLFVEEVAASLVREFLSRKGLKKTCVTMDQERPRSDLSINSRNNLRKVLHLEFLYKENKAGMFVQCTYRVTECSTLVSLLAIPLGNLFNGNIPPFFFCRHDNLDGDVLGNFVSSKRPPHKSKPLQTVPAESLPVAPAREKTDKLQSSEPPLDTKRVGERIRPKSGLIVRGMMAGPTASSPQDSLRRRSLRRPLALSSVTQTHEEEEEESRKAPELSTRTPACPAPQEGLASSAGSTARSPLGQLSEPTSEKRRSMPSSPAHLLSQALLQRGSGRWTDLSEDSPAANSGPEADGTPLKFLPGGTARTTQERLERAFKRQGSLPLPLRKNQLPVSSKADGDLGALQLEDVEDELIREEVILSPAPSMPKLQIVSKPIDLSVAKGGPCGVLAAVQGCVLQKLLFEGDSRDDCARQLQPSNTRRTHCLALAISDIVWRAGGHERAVVTLASGTQQFSPTGKYKADGVLETFEVGPYGCILLTLSAILSRSTELVRQDFDVPTSHLIGAHGYCTQELVNLLLTGRAVSNVFNDVVELDSGNGDVTLLKGIAGRSDIGFLSLFEHYNVCQVGCFLKTPRLPIWVVCSESHFSVLFSVQPELLRDWRAERLFDLYYYDGLANQQEQIRLTIDTTQTVPEDGDNDLIPPLELCIRTKWKGASVNWNGSEPIL